MSDANGATGGVGDVLNTNPASSTPSCNIKSPPTKSLDFSVANPFLQCGNLAISVIGGMAPYTLSVLPTNGTVKTVHYANAPFEYVLDVAAGTNVSFAVQDSMGLGAVGSPYVVGSSENTACLNAVPSLYPGNPSLTKLYPGGVATPTPSAIHQGDPPVLPLLQGGVLAGIVIACVLLPLSIGGFICWCMCCRRRRTHLRRIKTIDRASIDPSEPTTFDPHPYRMDHPMELSEHDAPPPRYQPADSPLTPTEPTVILVPQLSSPTRPASSHLASPFAFLTYTTNSSAGDDVYSTPLESSPISLSPKVSPTDTMQLFPASSQQQDASWRQSSASDHSLPYLSSPDPVLASQSFVTTSLSSSEGPSPSGAARPHSFLRLPPLSPTALSGFRLSLDFSSHRTAPSTANANSEK
ncbi:hypothetical protein FRB99_004404 [Tulasnella sp. 403]|nr:hypothetical protein FRB99_004404 [Tulasnella sp. 403]